MKKVHRSIMQNRRVAWVLLFLCPPSALLGNGVATMDSIHSTPELHGSLQTDMLFPENDTRIGSTRDDGRFNTNTYLDLNLQAHRFSAGTRLEYLEHPLPGFDSDFKGWGVSHLYVMGTPVNGLELTAGDFYEQFGSGLIFRAYEDRALGVDNAVRGGRIRFTPGHGITLKALEGVQRHYWYWSTSPTIYGADAEVDVTECLSPERSGNWNWIVGAGWVLQNRKDIEVLIPGKDIRLNMPSTVQAVDIRSRLTYGDLSISAEHAAKGQDPNVTNGYTYRHGMATSVSLSWMQPGRSILLQARRSENMDFLQNPTLRDNTGHINNLPPFTTQHSYMLPALYPYATQPLGEWAYQAEAGYKWKKHTLLGGLYGTHIKLNASLLFKLPGADETVVMGTDGNPSAFFKTGKQIYRDVNLTLEKKLSRSFSMNLFYMNQYFDKTAIQGEGGDVHANIFVAEGRYAVRTNTILRGELQYLTTGDDQGDWLYAIVELSHAPHWSFSLSDLWNSGVTKTHYYQMGVTYSSSIGRLNVAYGRTRAGYNCSGGVCRWIPSTHGLTIGYNYTF